MTMKTNVLAIALGVATAAACASGATEKTKKMLAEHGTIDGEWEIRDEPNEKTYTYVLLRTPSGVHETYEIIETGRQRAVLREQVGGIDRTGCFLLERGPSTPWLMQRPPETLQGTTQSGDKTRTACLEYKDTPGWMFIPAKERKAAEPPPPPPPVPTVNPDAGTAEPDMGAKDPGEVKSALPL